MKLKDTKIAEKLPKRADYTYGHGYMARNMCTDEIRNTDIDINEIAEIDVEKLTGIIYTLKKAILFNNTNENMAKYIAEEGILKWKAKK